MLKESTISIIAIPGAKESRRIGEQVLVSITDHRAPGGCPRLNADTQKLSPASDKIAEPIVRVISTSSGGKAFGRM